MRRQHGFSLIEVMVALGVLSIGGYFLISILKTGAIGQKTLLAQDEARVLTDNMANILSNADACEYTIGDGKPPSKTPLASPVNVIPDGTYTGTPPAPNTYNVFPITKIYDASGNVQFEVTSPPTKYGSKGIQLKGITVGGTGESKGGPRWLAQSATSGTAVAEVDWEQTGGAGNSQGPQILKRFFMIYVTNLNGHAATTCTAKLGGGTGGGVGTGAAGSLAIWDTDTTLKDAKIYHDTATGNTGFGTSADPGAKVTIATSAAHQAGLIVKSTAFASSSTHGIVGQGCAGHNNCYGLVGLAGDNGIASGVIGQSPDEGVYGISGYRRQYSFYGNSGAFLSGGTWGTSDARLKENVTAIDRPLERILTTRPVRFDWKRDTGPYRGGQRGSFGFLAQELEKVFPEAVREIEAPGRVESPGKAPLTLEERLGRFKIAQYEKLVAVTIAALQEAWARLTASLAAFERRFSRTEARLEESQAKIRALERRVDALQAYICAKEPALEACK
jgi:prepilin-type N-terminal cleavage/methylation domain-containing protein